MVNSAIGEGKKTYENLKRSVDQGTICSNMRKGYFGLPV